MIDLHTIFVKSISFKWINVVTEWERNLYACPVNFRSVVKKVRGGNPYIFKNIAPMEVHCSQTTLTKSFLPPGEIIIFNFERSERIVEDMKQSELI